MTPRENIKHDNWIAIEERFPEKKEGFGWLYAWSTDPCIVTINRLCNDPKKAKSDVVTGRFFLLYTKEPEGQLAFKPDRKSDLIPRNLEYIKLDEHFVCSLPDTACMGSYSEEYGWVSNQRLQITAWQPLPKPYEGT